MAKKVTYELYQESDAPNVVKLLRSNKFYFSKFDDDLTVDRFLELQKRRGLICAIVAKKDDEIIAHVAAYHNGGQRIAAKHQVIVSSMLIDKSYRRALLTVMNLYTSLLEEIIKRGYTEIISEVAYNNMASFFLLRKCEFILLDDVIDNYGNYVLHNYFPGIVKLIQSDQILSSGMFSKILPVVNKKKYLQKEEVVYGHYIEHIFNSPYGKMKLLINLDNGLVAGFELLDKIKIYPVFEGEVHYEIRGLSWENQSLVVNLVDDEDKSSSKDLVVEYDEAKIIDINTLKELKVEFKNIDLKLSFMIKEVLLEKIEEVSETKFNEEITLNEIVGFLEYRREDKIKVKEMWPFTTDPFIDGMVIPNKEKGLEVIEKDDAHIVIKEERNDCEVVRSYKKEDGLMSINTKVNLGENAEIHPVFHFGLDDIKFKCNIETRLGNIEKEFDPMDTYRATEELFYVDFKQEDYSKEYFNKIVVEYEDAKYEITTEKPARCFTHFNYIGIVYDEEVYKDKKNIDFGDIKIKVIK